ncbi:hypothetical protein SRB5_46610 [Streptomyces sp. RB5]|uniref:DUF397 domain-containing protein n=1 Tax=Streptomyces smaragdinus TaxID=2585196 RepID=A0A7K0CMJ7_9ACTN|nr:DUF397 domain-containing protein [Streptomyces smaragdinus]MQY14493.1 hypothetical protein [Streptomyces smaragdinus]
MEFRHAGRGNSTLKWFKSTYSGSGGGDCIEIALTPTTIHIRDSKNPTGPALHVPPDAWAAFISFVNNLPKALHT